MPLKECLSCRHPNLAIRKSGIVHQAHALKSCRSSTDITGRLQDSDQLLKNYPLFHKFEMKPRHYTMEADFLRRDFIFSLARSPQRARGIENTRLVLALLTTLGRCYRSCLLDRFPDRHLFSCVSLWFPRSNNERLQMNWKDYTTSLAGSVFILIKMGISRVLLSWFGFRKADEWSPCLTPTALETGTGYAKTRAICERWHRRLLELCSTSLNYLLSTSNINLR